VKRRQLLFSILKGAVLGIGFDQLVHAQEQLDPLKIMPGTHRLLFENEFVRVIESKVPAGERSRNTATLTASPYPWPTLTPKLKRFPMARRVAYIALSVQLHGTRLRSMK
jgi:hypothetical protein